MQDATTYSHRKNSRKDAKGSTLVVPCSFNALLKFDRLEAPPLRLLGDRSTPTRSDAQYPATDGMTPIHVPPDSAIPPQIR